MTKIGKLGLCFLLCICASSPSSIAQTAPSPGLSLNQQSLNDLDNCNYILADKICTSYLGKTKEEIIAMLGKPTEDYMVYENLGVSFSEGRTGTISEVIFTSQMQNNTKIDRKFIKQPAQKLPWGASKKDTIAFVGKPLLEKEYENIGKHSLVYQSGVISFKNDKLYEIYFAKSSDINSMFGLNNKPAPPPGKTPPATKLTATKAIIDEGWGVHLSVVNKVKMANEIIDEYNKNLYIYTHAFTAKGYEMQQQAAKLRSEARKAIYDFFKTNENVVLPSELVERLNDDLSKLNGQQ